MIPEHLPNEQSIPVPESNWRREQINPIPGMGTHSTYKQKITISDNFEVHFEKGSQTVNGFSILAYGNQILFQSMTARNASALVDRLVGLINQAPTDVIADDPLPDLLHLRTALEYADEKDIQFLSTAGITAAEICAAVGEAILMEKGETAILQTITMTEVEPNIYHIHMPTDFLLAATFLRFTEHFESPVFRNKVFSLGEYKEWFRKTKGEGEFNYYEAWGGFNVPDYSFDAFLSGRFNPLSPQEKALLEIVSTLEKPFYIIGTPGRYDSETLRHETAHGLFHVNSEYRKEAKRIIKSIDAEPIRSHLLEIGYCRAVLQDEVHAYVGDPLQYLDENGINSKPYKKCHAALLDLYKRHTTG